MSHTVTRMTYAQFAGDRFTMKYHVTVVNLETVKRSKFAHLQHEVLATL